MERPRADHRGAWSGSARPSPPRRMHGPPAGRRRRWTPRARAEPDVSRRRRRRLPSASPAGGLSWRLGSARSAARRASSFEAPPGCQRWWRLAGGLQVVVPVPGADTQARARPAAPAHAWTAVERREGEERERLKASSAAWLDRRSQHPLVLELGVEEGQEFPVSGREETAPFVIGIHFLCPMASQQDE